MEQQLVHAESAKQIAANRKALERSEKRISELKRLFIKIYEYCFTTPRHLATSLATGVVFSGAGLHKIWNVSKDYLK